MEWAIGSSLRYLKSGTRQMRPYYNVATDAIQFKCTGVPKSVRKKGKLFRHGEWDLNWVTVSDVQQSPRYLFYKEHLIDNMPIKQTSAYAYYRERQAMGRPRVGFETEEAILRRLRGYVAMFRDIERAGKVTPGYELKGRRGDEVGCVMDREGQLLKLSNGNNRFAIATLLQLPTVPISIDFLHMDLLKDVVATRGILPGQKINRFLLDRIGVARADFCG